MVIQIRVVGPKGEEKNIDVSDNEQQMRKTTVLKLKKIISKELTISHDFRVVFGTEPLEESSLLSHYGIRHMSTVHTVLMVLGGI